MQFKNGEQQISSLNRKIKAYEYYQKQKMLLLKKEDNTNLEVRQQELEQEVNRNKKNLEDLEEVLAQSSEIAKDNKVLDEKNNEYLEKNKAFQIAENDLKNA